MPEDLEPLGPASLIIPAATDTPEVRIGKGSALTLAAQVLGLGTSFLVGVLVARLLGAEGKGMLAVVMQVPGILLVLLDLGITTSNVYHVSRGQTAVNTAAANSAVLAGLFGLIGAPVVYLLLIGPLAVAPGIPALAVVFAVLALPTGLYVAWLNGISTGAGNLSLPLMYAATSSLTTLAGLGFLTLTGRMTISGVVGVSVAGTFVGLVVLLLGLGSQLRPFRADVTSMRSSASFSAKAYLGNVAGFLLERQDVLLLGWLGGLTQVGLYSVGVSFAELTWYIPTALGTAIAAKGGRTTEESGVDYVSRTTRIAVVVMTLTTLAALIAVPLLVPLIYGGAFRVSVYVFLAILPGVLVDGIARILWTYQTMRGRQYWRQAVTATVSNIVAVIVLVPRFGAVGAALASTLTYGGLGAFTIWRFCRDTGATWVDVVAPQLSDIQVIVRTVRGLLPGERDG